MRLLTFLVNYWFQVATSALIAGTTFFGTVVYIEKQDIQKEMALMQDTMQSKDLFVEKYDKILQQKDSIILVLTTENDLLKGIVSTKEYPHLLKSNECVIDCDSLKIYKDMYFYIKGGFKLMSGDAINKVRNNIKNGLNCIDEPLYN